MRQSIAKSQENAIHNSVAPLNEGADFPTLTLQAEIRGAIDGINKLEDLMTDGDPNDYLEYCHQLIKYLEKKRESFM